MRSKSKWIILLGMLLLACSLGILLYTQFSAQKAQKTSADTVALLEEILPPKSLGVVDNYSSMQMPCLEIDRIEIVAVLEIPDWNVALPIRNSWDAKTLISGPQRFAGTVYDGSLIVGGMDQVGQFDCLKKLDIGNTIIITDMTGAQFSYTVERVERKKSADIEVLADTQSNLSLFVRDVSSMDYIIVRCTNQ